MSEDALNVLKKYYLLHGTTWIDFELLEKSLDFHHNNTSLLDLIVDLLNREYLIGYNWDSVPVKSYEDSNYYQISDKFVGEFLSESF